MKKIDFSNPENWQEKVDGLASHYKKLAFEALRVLGKSNLPNSTNIAEFSILLKDVDVALYMATTHHFVTMKIEQYPEFKVHLQNKDIAKLLLINDCAADIKRAIYKTHPDILTDRDFVRNLFITNTSFFQMNEYINYYKDLDFVKDVVEHGFNQINIILPYHKHNIEISKLAILKTPSEHFGDAIAPEVFADKDFMLGIFNKVPNHYSSYHHSFYNKLPESLKNDIDICDAVWENFPSIDLSKTNYVTFDKLFNKIKHIDGYKEQGLPLSLVRRYDYLIHDTENMMKMLELLSERAVISPDICEGHGSFICHPIQIILLKLAEVNEIMADFMASDDSLPFKGSVDDAKEYDIISKQYMPQLFNFVYKHYLQHTLDSSTVKTKQKKI